MKQPEGIEIGTTIFLTTLDEPVPAYSGSQGIVYSRSHPLFKYAALVYEPTGLSTFLNLSLQELHHHGFSNAFTWPSVEEHMENEVVIDMLVALQIDGMATYIEYKLSDT